MSVKGWMGRADQTTKVNGMFVRPEQIAEIGKRHPELGRLAPTSSTLPPSFATARKVAASSLRSASVGDALSAFSVIASVSPARVTTSRLAAE
jgi:phenylacetate-CoA ligase